MGHRKLIKFKENEGFQCLIQPQSNDIITSLDKADIISSGIGLKSHSIRGNWNNDMFKNQNPIVVELGCGRGEYTIDLGLRNHNCNYIGVDIKGARLWKGAKYATENNMPNVAFLRTRVEFIEAFFSHNEVSEIWLTFSDPQLKSENKRLTSPIFLEKYRKILKKGGIIHLKTDSQFLHEYSKQVALQNGLKILACTNDLYNNRQMPAMESICGKDAVNSLFEVQTYYERLFLEKGFKITYLSFVIDHDGEYVAPSWDEELWREKEGARRVVGFNVKED